MSGWTTPTTTTGTVEELAVVGTAMATTKLGPTTMTTGITTYIGITTEEMEFSSNLTIQIHVLVAEGSTMDNTTTKVDGKTLTE